MNVLNLLLATLSTYTIPANTEYVWQGGSDPNIGATTVVNLEQGAIFNCNAKSPTLPGITGYGVVTNINKLTLTLEGGPYRYDGQIFGSVTFDQGTVPNSEFGLIAGASNTLAGATVIETATTVHPIRFAGRIGRFFIGTLQCETGPTLTLTDADNEPISVYLKLSSTGNAKFSATGAGNLYFNGSGQYTVPAAADLSGVTGEIGLMFGRVSFYPTDLNAKCIRFDGTEMPSSALNDHRWHTANGTSLLTYNLPIRGQWDNSLALSFDVESPVVFEDVRMTGIKRSCTANCTSLVLKKGYMAVNTQSAAASTMTCEIQDGAMYGGSLGSWYGDPSVVVHPTLAGGTEVGKTSVTVRRGGELLKGNYSSGALTYIEPGARLTVGDRCGRGAVAGTEIHLDGCDLRMVRAFNGTSYYMFDNMSSNMKVYLGANRVQAWTDMFYGNPYSQEFCFHKYVPLRTNPNVATDGGIEFKYGKFVFGSPQQINGTFRAADGWFLMENNTENSGLTAPVFGTGDLEIVNGAIQADYATAKLAESSRVVYEGAATIMVRGHAVKDARTLTIGQSGAAKDSAIVRRGHGVITFADNYQVANAKFDGTGAKAYVNGGLTAAADGRVLAPVFTAARPDTSARWTQVDFAAINNDNLITAYTGYYTPYTTEYFVEGSDKVVKVASDTQMSTDSTVAGINVSQAKLTLNDNTTLTIANGSQPGVLIGNNSSGSSEVAGNNAKIDFGSREGIVMVGQKGYGSQPFVISTLVDGTGGMVFAASRCGFSSAVALTKANTYTGGSWVNGCGVHVRNAEAFSNGDITIGDGYCMGGRLVFDVANVVITNHVIGAGYGPYHNYTDSDGNTGLLVFKAAGTGLAGPLDLTGPGRVRVDAGVEAEISGVISGDRLQLWASDGTLRLTGENVHTGGTEIARSTLVVTNAVALGTGTVTLDGGTLRFENTAPITVSNLIRGVGTLQLAGSAPVTFTNLDDDEFISKLTIDTAGGTAVLQKFPPTVVSMINSSGATGMTVTLPAGRNQLPKGFLSTDTQLRLLSGSILDLGWNALTVAEVGGSGEIRCGVLTVLNQICPGGNGSLGTLTFAQAPVCGSGAKLVIECQNGDMDKLVVRDNFNLASLALQITALGSVSGSTQTIVDLAGKARTGNFASVTATGCRAWDLEYLNSSVSLTLSSPGLILLLK